MQEKGEIKSKPSLLGFVAVKKANKQIKQTKTENKNKNKTKEEAKENKSSFLECTLIVSKIKKIRGKPTLTLIFHSEKQLIDSSNN